MHIAMIGCGYVGLVSAACLADLGHEVISTDLDMGKIEQLRSGGVPIYEPGLQGLINRNVREGRLTFTSSLESALSGASVAFIAVGTPSRRGDGHADLSFVYSAVENLAKTVKGPMSIVIKSTVPVGTGDEVARICQETCPEFAFDVISNPEFLREGEAIADFKHPDRIIVGIETSSAKELMDTLYHPVYVGNCPIVFVRRRTAELIKYASNAFLAMKISFINEMSDFCEVVGGESQELARGIGLDRRIGSRYLSAGPGFGGSCFPKDTEALIRTAREHQSPLRIIETVVSVNEARKLSMGRRVIQACGGTVEGKTIAVLGLAFKPNTDDMRQSPALTVIAVLREAGANVRGYDPASMESASKMLPDIYFASGPYDCCTGASAVVIITEWDEFRALDLDRLVAIMRVPLLIDLRNVYSRSEVERHGMIYRGIGQSILA